MLAPTVDRPRGPSARLRLTLSYAAFLLVAGAVLLAAVWLFLLRDVPAQMLVPDLSRLPSALDPSNFGPAAFGPAVIVVMGFLLVFGVVGGWVLAGRMLAPLARIAEATRRASAGSLSHRIALEGHHDEFRELADAFDAMLARLERQVAEQQRFAANASHELRTPLAVTRTVLEVARDDPDHDTAELLERLQVVNSRAISLTEALLLLSRSDQRSFVRERVDLSLVVEEAAETLLPLAEKYGVSLDVTGDVAPTCGSHPLLLQMIMNLVHNAVVHNLPEGGLVQLRTGADRETTTLTVENTGVDLDPALVATLTEPFQRGAARIRDDLAGVGLGLAIVESVVEAHEGTLLLAPRRGGGLHAVVRLPASPD